ncbi:MAG: DUF4097 family beta strand repeat-containing protein [Erysipelotrichaceae bacterium]|nr:DUF4097 family beta strand repeat-containing protein [Erysipelotrichaceae bacterium]
MKKLSMIIICFALMFSLTACSGNNDNDVSGTSKVETTENNNQDFSNISIRLIGGAISVSLGDALSLTYEDGTEIEYSIDDDTLSISQEDVNDMILVLPSGNSYDDVTFYIERAQLSMEDSLDVNKLSMDVNNGELSLEDLTVSDSCDMSVYQGTIYVNGNVTNIDATSNEGHIEIKTSYTQTDYNYELSMTNGGVTLGDDYYGESSSIDNDADYMMTLSSTTGDISVEYTK